MQLDVDAEGDEAPLACVAEICADGFCVDESIPIEIPSMAVSPMIPITFSSIWDQCDNIATPSCLLLEIPTFHFFVLNN